MYRTRFFTSEQYPLLSFRLDSYFLREIVICIRLSPPVQLPSLSPIHSTILLAYTSPKTYLSPRFSATVCCFPTFLFRTPANPTDSRPRTRRLTSSLVSRPLAAPVDTASGKQFHTDVCEHYIESRSLPVSFQYSLRRKPRRRQPHDRGAASGPEPAAVSLQSSFQTMCQN